MNLAVMFEWIGRKVLPSTWFTYPQPNLTKNDLLQRLGLSKLEVIRHYRYFLWIKLPVQQYQIHISYWWHRINKKDGTFRHLHSPNPKVRTVQKLLHRKLFSKLRVHPCAFGFRRHYSTFAHANLHVGKSVVVRIDIKDFFHQTDSIRIYQFLRYLGWNHEAAEMIVQFCTWKGCLPQGAPTSPILSNLVNYRMDARLAGLAKRSNATYSRYADDIIFSFTEDDRRFIRGVIRRVARILNETGYRMNRSKLRVMRQHNRQIVTGLVVNEKVQLPRKTRRWLRAVEHRLKNGLKATLTREQLTGWKAYQQSIQTNKK